MNRFSVSIADDQKALASYGIAVDFDKFPFDDRILNFLNIDASSRDGSHNMFGYLIFLGRKQISGQSQDVACV